VVVPLARTFLVSSGERVLVHCASPVVPVLPKTTELVLILLLAWVVRPQELGIDSLHVRVVPVPVAATVFDSAKRRRLVVPSTTETSSETTETSSEQVMLVRAVVLRVIVSVTVIVWTFFGR
jgi:hypothetical protein